MIRAEKRQSRELESHRQATPLTRVQSEYQQIEITAHPVYGNQLVIDDDLQISEADHAYNTAMVAPLVPLGDLGQVAILGGGDGGVLNELLQTAERLDLPLEKATLIDIDSEVMRLSRTYLHTLCGEAFAHPKAEVIVGDAYAYLAEAENLDAVIYDLTMEPVCERQDPRQFIAEVVSRMAEALRPGGMLSMQCCGEGLQDPEAASEAAMLLASIRSEVDHHFTALTEQQVVIPSYHERWTFLAARRP